MRKVISTVHFHKTEDDQMIVTQQADGTFYLQANDFDAERQTQEDVNKWLAYWGYHVEPDGWE